MQKTLLLLLSFIGILHSTSAQLVWQKKMPLSPFNVSFVRLSFDGEQYFINSNNAFAQVDQRGTVTGYIKQSTGPIIFWTSVEKRQSPSSGHPYFLIAKRNNPSIPNYTLFEYRPGVGAVNEKVFADSLGTFSGKRPQIVALNDSVFVVFGRQYYRKVRYSQSTGFTEEWLRSLNMLVEAAFLHNNLFIVADALGLVVALDENGNTVWSYFNNTISFRSLKPVADGFIGCGRSSDDKGVIIKLDLAGAKVWEKETDDDEYHDVIATSGGYAVTGQSKADSIMLAVTDSEGNQLWKQEYVLA
jgi:hypothetical protein